MRFFLFAAGAFFSLRSDGQLPIIIEVVSDQEIVYPFSDTSEKNEAIDYYCFPDEVSVDLESWKNYLKSNLDLDESSMDSIPTGFYTVVVQFLTGENGKPGNISILKEPGYGLGERVKKVVANCKGIWKPVDPVNDRLLRKYRIQSITFVVEESCDELSETFML